MDIIKEAVAVGSGDDTIYELADLAVKHKLIEYIPYDEKKHGVELKELWGIEEGDMIYFWGNAAF